jgi:hypothetical protein
MTPVMSLFLYQRNERTAAAMPKLSKKQVRRVQAVLLQHQRAAGRPLSAAEIQAAGRTVVGESMRLGASRDKAVAESTALLGQLVTAGGKVKPVRAKKANKKAAARPAAGETVQQKVDRLISEALTAAGVLAPQAGKGASAEAAGSDGLFGALASQGSSPFWRQPTSAAAGASKGAGPTTADLAAMDPDQLRSYAAGEFKALATAGGLGGPLWADA